MSTSDREPLSRRILLAARPSGEPKLEDFSLAAAPVPVPADGEVLLRTLYLSLDPYMRGRMSEAKSYAASTAIGAVMPGATVAEVLRSSVAEFQPGDIVEAYAGWQEYAAVPTKTLRKVDRAAAPISTALGVLGMPGFTAYSGLLTIGNPQPGETVVVAAASGAVGSVVGQIAKLKGCRVVGVAGSERKCKYVVDELGFEACINHRGATLGEELAAACPGGIDVYFENVGGLVLEAVWPLLNPFARIPVCGLIAHYNATGLPPGPNRLPLFMRDILTKRLTLRGFIVSDFNAQYPDFQRDVGQWVREGSIRYREDIVDGLENAPRAFLGLLRGENFGKLLIRVAPAPEVR